METLADDEEEVEWMTSFDVCGVYKEGYEPVRPNDPMYRVGVCTRYEISHPEYNLMSRTLKTFEGWPKEKMHVAREWLRLDSFGRVKMIK